jgi:MFS superfamily sulfate permease-like transporter
MTLTLTDEITETRVDRTGEFLGQGATNAVTEFFGGMGRMCHDWTTHD